MSRKENLLKFWEGIENNKKGLQISPRSSNTRPQKLIIEKNFQNCLSVVNNTDNIRVKLHQNIGDVSPSPALEVPSQCPDSLPLLPRQDILPQPTKNRARREARARSSNRERPRYLSCQRTFAKVLQCPEKAPMNGDLFIQASQIHIFLLCFDAHFTLSIVYSVLTDASRR